MKIDFKKLTGNIEKSIINGINKATELIFDKVQEKSPEDSGDYIRGHELDKAIVLGNTIKGSVYNDMEYAQNVEYGWRTTPVNWYKNRKQGGPRIYKGVGARVYTRTFDEYERDVKNIINKSINNAIK